MRRHVSNKQFVHLHRMQHPRGRQDPPPDPLAGAGRPHARVDARSDQLRRLGVQGGASGGVHLLSPAELVPGVEVDGPHLRGNAGRGGRPPRGGVGVRPRPQRGGKQCRPRWGISLGETVRVLAAGNVRRADAGCARNEAGRLRPIKFTSCRLEVCMESGTSVSSHNPANAGCIHQLRWTHS